MLTLSLCQRFLHTAVQIIARYRWTNFGKPAICALYNPAPVFLQINRIHAQGRTGNSIQFARRLVSNTLCRFRTSTMVSFQSSASSSQSDSINAGIAVVTISRPDPIAHIRLADVSAFLFMVEERTQRRWESCKIVRLVPLHQRVLLDQGGWESWGKSYRHK